MAQGLRPCGAKRGRLWEVEPAHAADAAGDDRRSVGGVSFYAQHTQPIWKPKDSTAEY